jgi:hypothetical protein
MKKFAFVPMVALAFAACADNPTASVGADSALQSRGVSNPGTVVTFEAVISIGEGGTYEYRDSGPGNNGKGTCYGGGHWYNPQTRTTSDKPHPQCRSLMGGESFTLRFEHIANYVLATNGNVQLTFGDDRALHYQSNQNRTQGAGVLVHIGDELDATREWTVDLGQNMLRGSGNLLDPAGTSLRICNVDLGCFYGSMSW